MKTAGLITILLFTSFVAAQAKVDFSATVSSNPVVVGEQFQLIFTITNGATRSIDPPEFDGLDFLNGPQVMQSTQNYNGRLSSTQQFVYVMRAKKEGAVVIGPATCTIDGKKYKSTPLKIQVVPKSQQQLARERALQKELSESVFLQATASKREVYQGEQVFLSYRMFTALQFGEQDFTEPSFKNLWLEKLDVENRGVQVQEGGKRMVRFDLVRALAFPQRSGELRIEPYTANLTVRIPSNKQGRDMFGFRRQQYKDEQVTLSSDRITLQVKTLPSQGKPVGFDGVVGEYTVELSADKLNAEANDAITVKIVYEGRGNLKLIDAPELAVPSDIEVYDPKVVDNISVSTSGMKGRRTFEYVLIPRRAGSFRIEAADVSWFNPKKEQYETLADNELVLTIGKGSGAVEGVVSAPTQREDIEIVGTDIRFLKSIDEAELSASGGAQFFGSTLFYVLGVLPFPLVFVLIGLRKNKGKEKTDSQRAEMSGKLFMQATKQLRSKGEVEYKDVEKALREFISNRFSLPLSDQNSTNISTALVEQQVSEVTIIELQSLLQQCSMSQYAPSTEQSSPSAVLEQAIEVVKRMEDVS